MAMPFLVVSVDVEGSILMMARPVGFSTVTLNLFHFFSGWF